MGKPKAYRAFACFTLCLCLCLFSGAARGEQKLYYSMSLPHYAREMEFYYQKPRPKTLPTLFRGLYVGGALDQNDKRLMVAAFFAALALEKKLDLKSLEPLARSLGDDALKTLAWSVHLANLKNGDALVQSLLGGNQLLIRQIGESPAPLDKWAPLAEPATLQMYWTAFMATGKNIWLDDIIKSALEYGRLKSQGRWQEHDYQVGRLAASSLFEFSKTHPRVRQRLQYFLKNSKNGAQRELLRQILQNDRPK